MGLFDWLSGPYEHYDATPGAVRASGQSVIATAGNVQELDESVRAGHAPATAGVTGVLLGPMVGAPKPVRERAQSLAQAAVVGGGAVRFFGNAIADFDSGVDRLNARWLGASLTGFGVPSPDYSGAENAADRQAVDTRHADAVAAARASLKAQLDKEYAALQSDLDGEAQQTAAMLDEGPSESVVLRLFQAGALPITTPAAFPGVDFGTIDYSALLVTLQRYGLLQQWMGGPVTGARDLRNRLDVLRQMGVSPQEYRQLLQQYWVAVAAEKAGIDIGAWDPTKGADALRDIIERVYTYYGQLFLDNPDLQWAGMANMIGPSFAGGFFDLAMLRRVADALGTVIDSLPFGVGGLLPGALPAVGAVANLSEAEIRFYETQFLMMQKEIFIDQASMHEAYLGGGMDALREMLDAGLIDPATLNAWQQIDSGDPASVAAGNTQLLYREQHDIIRDDWDRMYSHFPSGPAVTYLMGAVGQPSVPGAQSLGDISPLEVRIPVNQTPFGWVHQTYVEVRTPLPSGNIADFDTRWHQIETDTLPAYQQVITSDPAYAREIIGSSIHDRIETQRLDNRIDDIIVDLATDWDVGVDW